MQTKKGKIIFGFLLVFLLISFVSSLETEIKIKTMPANEVTVAIGEVAGEGNSWKFLKKTSDEYGDAVFAVPINTEKYDLIVTIKKDGEIVKHPSFDNPYKSYGEIAGEQISLELYPDWFTPIESSEKTEVVVEDNSTEEVIEDETTAAKEEIVEETEVAEENAADNKELTGSSVAEEHSSSSKTFYYGLVFIALLMISFISFLAVKKMDVVKRKKGKEKLDNILDDMDAKGKPKKKKKDLVEDVKKKMKDIEAEMEELRDN